MCSCKYDEGSWCIHSYLQSMKRPLLSGTIPRLLWCITVAVMAKKVKMKRMKVCPSVIRYLTGRVTAGGLDAVFISECFYLNSNIFNFHFLQKGHTSFQLNFKSSIHPSAILLILFRIPWQAQSQAQLTRRETNAHIHTYAQQND